MPRELIVTCNNCGKRKEARPRTWFLLEEQSEVLRTAPIDLCSLKCIREWANHPAVAAALPDAPAVDKD